ncbi:hypothetical protein AB205_0050180, partial [Aquarana catesbeiana]
MIKADDKRYTDKMLSKSQHLRRGYFVLMYEEIRRYPDKFITKCQSASHQREKMCIIRRKATVDIELHLHLYIISSCLLCLLYLRLFMNKPVPVTFSFWTCDLEIHERFADFPQERCILTFLSCVPELLWSGV